MGLKVKTDKAKRGPFYETLRINIVEFDQRITLCLPIVIAPDINGTVFFQSDIFPLEG